jgi:hypothetical protein
VHWSSEKNVLSCPLTFTELSLPPRFTEFVRRIGPDEIVVDLTPDAILLMRGGRGKPPPLLDDWGSLHTRLSGVPPAGPVNWQLDRAYYGGSWDYVVDYELPDAGPSTGFRAADRSVQRRDGYYCRLLAVERNDALPDRSTVQILQIPR